MVTKEMLNERLAELYRQHTDAVAKVNAIGGAIQDCEYWLKRLAKGEQPTEPRMAVVS